MLDLQDLTVAAAILLAAEIVGILFAVDAVMGQRSSQGTIAWAIGLVALPVVAIPLYVLFGRTRFRGYVVALREADARVARLASPIL